DGSARGAVRQLLRLGLLEPETTEGPRTGWTVRPPAVLWDALRGELDTEPAPWLRHERREDLRRPDDLRLDEAAGARAARVPAALFSGNLRTIVVRGHARSGRRTLLGAIAREIGLDLLEVEAAAVADERWRLVGPLATVLRALPVCALDLGPGESAEVGL